MDDMINMVMFTFEANMMNSCGVVDLDRVSLNNRRDVEFSGSSLR